ncbi:MAG: NAD(P)-binding protein, partial [Myxococcota bacterium]
MPTRRDVLVSFLGLAAADACRRAKVEPRPIPGALVDRVHEVGHLLRGAPLPRTETVTARHDVLVIGAGAAGLSAGWRLRGAGFDDFLVLEVDDEVGGTARAGKNDVSAFPWGAHYLPAPLDARGPVPRLLKEVGVLTGVDE